MRVSKPGWLAVLACLLVLSGLTELGISPLAAQVFTQPSAPRAPSRPRPRPAPVVNPAPERERIPAAMSRQMAPARPTTYRDPAPYCAANPDVDVPTSPYSGQPVPGWVSAAWMAGAGKQAVGEHAFSWRCMGGRVFVCASAPDRLDCGRPDESRVATPEMIAACTGKRKGALPADLVGNSLALWSCSNGVPTITGYRSGLDPRGYFASLWRDVSDYSPANMIGSVPLGMIGTWAMQWQPTFGELLTQSIIANGRPISSVPRMMSIRVQGGQNGASIGTIEYFVADRQGNLQLGCQADLILVSSTPGRIEVDERIRVQAVQCGSPDRLTLAARDGQLMIEWRSPSSASGSKARRSGWAQRQ